MVTDQRRLLTVLRKSSVVNGLRPRWNSFYFIHVTVEKPEVCKNEKRKRVEQSRERTKHRHNKIEIHGEITGILACKSPWFGSLFSGRKKKGKAPVIK